MAEVLRQHGWHVIAELAVLALVTVFTVFYLVALVRGRVRAVICPSCGRVTSRADVRCPRCRRPLQA